MTVLMIRYAYCHNEIGQRTEEEDGCRVHQLVEYIRRAIAERVEREGRREATAKLLDSLQRGFQRVPNGFVNEAIRKDREQR